MRKVKYVEGFVKSAGGVIGTIEIPIYKNIQEARDVLGDELVLSLIIRANKERLATNMRNKYRRRMASKK